MAGNENGPRIEPTSKTKKKKDGGGGEKQKPYVFRHGMINKMFFFIDIKNEST